MASFFDKHGTVLLLYSIVALMAVATLYIGLHSPNEKVFDWAAGFTGGAFSGLTVALQVTKSPIPAPDPKGAPIA